MSELALRAIAPHVIRVITVDEIEETPQCDLICVASFPRIIPRTILARASRGGLNVHASLLPKHRGPDPLFWTYFDFDESAGVTLHWIDEGIDSGDVVAQRAWPLERGTRAIDLYMQQAEVGTQILDNAIANIDSLTRTPQDASRATIDPSPNKHTWSIDYTTWPARRVWHFLNGMSELRRDLLTVPYAPGFALHETQHDRTPGTIVARGGKIAVYCKDGIVEGTQLPWRTRLRRWLKRTSSRR